LAEEWDLGPAGRTHASAGPLSGREGQAHSLRRWSVTLRPLPRRLGGATAAVTAHPPAAG